MTAPTPQNLKTWLELIQAAIDHGAPIYDVNGNGTHNVTMTHLHDAANGVRRMLREEAE